jgi:hypothetical protein
MPASSYQLVNSSCSTSTNLACSTAGPLQQLLLPTPGSSPAEAAAVHSEIAAAASVAYAAVLLLLAGHATLHLYYIATWSSSRHSRNVIEMSAVSSESSRLQRFRAWEVLWFWVGMSYDIVTHVIVNGLLLHTIWSVVEGGCALPMLPWQSVMIPALRMRRGAIAALHIAVSGWTRDIKCIV